ncbi:MAG: HisA/HisF-related TIM barrel protein, partial [Candidatus Thermoplasmatota archaeon]|nr:HisA/HisF-related TIM barrel protein [Candidatus Thermoplasmatota archaeon]
MSPPNIVALWVKGDNVVLPTLEGYRPLREDEGTADPVDVIEFLGKKFERFLLFDLDGIERGEPQLELVQDCSLDHEIWVDSGIWRASDASDITMAGAARTICGTKGLRSMENLRDMADILENMVFSVDVAENIVAPFLESPSLEKILGDVSDIPLAGGMLVDIRGQWTNASRLEALCKAFEEFYYYLPKDKRSQASSG